MTSKHKITMGEYLARKDIEALRENIEAIIALKQLINLQHFLSMNKEINKHLGYYEGKETKVPTYDPGLDIECPICFKELTEDNLRTIGFLSEKAYKQNRSYFYRVHKSCHESLNEDQQNLLDSSFVDNL